MSQLSDGGTEFLCLDVYMCQLRHVFVILESQFIELGVCEDVQRFFDGKRLLCETIWYISYLYNIFTHWLAYRCFVGF